MGHEIVYCVRCATRLAGADFDRGNAFRAGGRIVCAACLPALVATLSPDEQQTVVSLSSTKMKPVKPAHPSGSHGTSVRLAAQRPVEPAAPKSSMGLILAVVGGAAALLIAVALFATRSSAAPPEPVRAPVPPIARPAPPEPPPREDPQIREARAAIEAARAKATSAPRDLDGQLAAWDEAARKSALTPFFKEATAALQEVRDKLAAMKPPPPPEPERKPAVPPPAEPADRPPSPDVKAYRLRWEAAMAKATEREFEAALAELGRAAAELGDDAVKRDARADGDLLRRARVLLADGQAALSRLSRGRSVSLRLRGSSGGRRQVDGRVARALNGRVEVRQGEESIFVEIEDVAAASLATALGVAKDDRRAWALLCVLEGDGEAAERLAGGGALAARYFEYAAGAAATVPPPTPREVEARSRFYAAEREFEKMETLPAAVVRYKSLADEYADTRVVKAEALRIQTRARAGREYVFVAGALKGAGTFALASAPRTEVAWTSKADVEGAQAVENYVEAEFAALGGTVYRCWALVGGCCAETFVFYLQTTEGTELHPKTRQRTSIDPGAPLASVVKHSLPGLKKTHEEHKVKGSKTHPKTAARWEWVSIPLPKYSVAGAKKIRLLSDQQGFGVGAVVVSSTRSSFLPEAELKEEIARVRSLDAASEPGLVGWWRLDEVSGTAVPNAVEGGPSGTIAAGSPRWTSGKVGGALKFDEGDEVRISGPFSFPAITLSAWVRHDGFTPPRQRYVTVGDEAAVIRCEGDGVHFYLRTDGDLRQIHVPGTLEPGKWTHVAGTWDGTTQKVYKDGVRIGAATPGGKFSGAMLVRIGADKESMRGAIDEVRIYDRALSDAEIQKQFAEGSAGMIAELGAAPPPLPAKPWKPLFDGATLQCLRNNGSGWRIENGAIAMIPGAADAGQTRESIDDGEMRIRFEVKDASRIWFKLRQGSGGGYAVEIEGAALKALEGKERELIFTAKGDQVTATLDGKPVAVQVNGPSKQGCLQFNGQGKTFHLRSIDVR